MARDINRDVGAPPRGQAKFELTCGGPAPCKTTSATADVQDAGGSWTLSPACSF